MFPKPQQEHAWLHKLVGDWTLEGDACGDGKATGREHVRSIGGLWVQCEGLGTMPGGGDAVTLMTLGYDPAKQRFVGSWIGSMMTYQWVYEGELGPTGRILTLNTVGPDFETEGKMSKYRDVIELVSDDVRTLTAYTQKEDGSWYQFMKTEYRRVK